MPPRSRRQTLSAIRPPPRYSSGAPKREAELGATQLAWPTKTSPRRDLVDAPWRFEPWSRETGMDRVADNIHPTISSPDPESQGTRAKDPVDRGQKQRRVRVGDATDAGAGARGHGDVGVRVQVAVRLGAKDKSGHAPLVHQPTRILLVGTKGDLPAPAPGTQWPSGHAPVGRHSEKPAIFAEMNEPLSDPAKDPQLFARGKARPGWTACGNEVRRRDAFRIVDGWIGRGRGSAPHPWLYG